MKSVKFIVNSRNIDSFIQLTGHSPFIVYDPFTGQFREVKAMIEIIELKDTILKNEER